MSKHRFNGSRGDRPPFFRRRRRHGALAEKGAVAPASIPPVPDRSLPLAFAANVFGRLDQRLQHAIADMGYAVPTPIQERSIGPLLEGRDLIGCAQTGTGKTAAFLLPILENLVCDDPAGRHPGHPKALVLSPTRELAAQIAENWVGYSKYVGTPFAVVFGGVGQGPQVKAVENGAVAVIATPGRLIDLMTQGVIYLDRVERFVLDEADRMLDMGFLPDIKRIISKLPAARQSLFFSATLSPEIMRLAGELVRDPVKVTIEPELRTAERINQKVMFVDKGNKDALLVHLLENHPEWDKVIVFAKMRHGADRVAKKLRNAGIPCAAIHSDKTQNQRTQALANFRAGSIRALVATDIASRGIDVPDVSLVVNMELPLETESYVHRIGRTARAGESGCAVSFVSAGERGLLKAVERFIKTTIPPDRDHPFHSPDVERGTGKSEEGLPTAPWVKSAGGRRYKAPMPGPDGGKRHPKKFIHPANAKKSHRSRISHRGRDQPDFGKKGE